MHFLIFLCALFLLPSFSNAQIPIRIKAFHINKSQPEVIAFYEGGKCWLDSKDRTTLYYDNGNELVYYAIEEKGLIEKNKENFLSAKQDNNFKTSPREALKRFYSLPFDEEKVLSYAMDAKGETFYVSDDKGYVYFFNIKKKYFEGRLRLSSKGINLIRPLKNGSILLFNEGGHIVYVEHVKIPFFSFLQNLKSSYKIAKEIDLPFNFLSRVVFNDKENMALLIGDHKKIFIIQLPSLERLKFYEEAGFIRYADFIDDSKFLYTVTSSFSKAETPFDINMHMIALAHFFDRSGVIIPSPSGKLLLRFEDRKELRLYKLAPLTKLVDFGDLIERGIEVTILPDDKTIILYSNLKNRFAFYFLNVNEKR